MFVIIIYENVERVCVCMLQTLCAGQRMQQQHTEQEKGEIRMKTKEWGEALHICIW